MTIQSMRPLHGGLSPGQRTSVSEFPTTPSTCHGTPGCASDVLETPQLEHGGPPGMRHGDPFIVLTPVIDKHWQTIGRHMSPAVNSRMEQVKSIKELLSEWDDEELVVLFPKQSKPNDLSSIAESSDGLTERKTISASDFEVIRPLRSPRVGCVGELVLGRKKDTSGLYAIKMFRKTSSHKKDIDTAQKEQAILKLLTERETPFAIRLHWSFQDAKALYLVTDLPLGGDLRMCIARGGSFYPEHARFYAAEIVEALSALHAAYIILRDLRPENVLFGKDGHVLLSEFEYAYIGEGPSCAVIPRNGEDVRSVRMYQAPELTLGWAHDCAVDWWSFGLVLCFMLTGRHPFVDEESSSTHPLLLDSHILHGKFCADQFNVADPPSFDLVAKCLERNPALRLKERNVKEHAYFADINWGQIKSKELPAPLVPEMNEHSARILREKAHGESTVTDRNGFSPSPLSCDVPDTVDGFSFTWIQKGTDGLDVQATSLPCTADQGPRLGCLGKKALSPASQDTLNSTLEEAEIEVSIPAEFGGIQRDLPSPKTKYQSGTLRKYSSLNFDSDTLPSAPSLDQDDLPGGGLSPFQKLRKSQSNFFSPITREPPGSPRARNKLRKKARPDSTPIPLFAQPALLDLPQGIEQIGNGIGYTRRAESCHPRFSISTLTPRTCHALFSGRHSGVNHKQGRKKSSSGSGERFEHPNAGVSIMGGSNESEDQMDAVMREMYGSRWNLGLSSTELSHAAAADPRVYASLARTSVGLGLGEGALELTRGMRLPVPPAELSTLSPDSTLRLVSPSTHGLEYC
ncbi:hypothetical protein AcV5_003997 [Taiwanofungus camphoratus]|nr:hypothetical protein AcV5_003997 [Antrodia cinnamomea]KAI0960854.1 hypothetical protein AcV7_000118 [Antrodia cinnamomea]